MNNTCPSCGKGYNLQPHHVGRRINCKNCGSALIVEADGLHLDPAAATSTAPPDVPGGSFDPAGGATAPPPIAAAPAMADFEDEPTGARLPPRRRSLTAGRSLNPQELMSAIPAWLDFSLFCFGVGLVLVLIFTLLPVMDNAKVSSWVAEINLGERLHQKRAADLKGEALEEENKKWSKDHKEMEERRERAVAAAQQWRWWYSWGLLFGFIVLAISALFFLRSDTRIRRVVGSIVLVAQVLLMFILFAAQSIR
jgi:ribosomal protein S27AE